MLEAEFVSKDYIANPLLTFLHPFRLPFPPSIFAPGMFRAEVFQEIADCADGVNHGLHIIYEAAAEDEAATLYID